jgi:hypothetical protein
MIHTNLAFYDILEIITLIKAVLIEDIKHYCIDQSQDQRISVNADHFTQNESFFTIVGQMSFCL